ncbi:MAG: diacylglycerol kinase family protein [Patescibacteria group bacterium]
MLKIFKSHHPVRHAKSFKYAFEGIFHALINEPNFRVQLVIVTLAIIFGKKFGISNTEWGLLAISLGSLLSAEMVNTVVEEVLDHFYLKEEENIAIKVIKDLSAGFVLITSITTLIILILVFGNKI